MIILSTLCYIKSGGKTLMMHRVKREQDIHQGKWNGLGGKFLAGETPEECVSREVLEESGLKILDPTLKGVIMFPEFDTQEDWLVFLFTASRMEGGLTESDEGLLEWIDDSKVMDLNLWEGDRLFLKWMEDPRFFSGKIVYEKGKLKDHDVVFYDYSIQDT